MERGRYLLSTYLVGRKTGAAGAKWLDGCPVDGCVTMVRSCTYIGKYVSVYKVGG